MKINFENIKNSKVILRADLNDSKNDKNIFESTYRMDAAISTINELISRKNQVIIISHLSEDGESLVDNANYLKKAIKNLIFLQTTDEVEIKNKIKDIELSVTFNHNSPAILLENIRLFGEKLEENNDENFAKWLSQMGEYFVFDAFSVAHRKHASVVGINKFLPSALGPNAERELETLQKVLSTHDNLALIMGGAKISTKISVIEKFLNKGAKVFLGGAMAHPILQKRGQEIGESKTENIELTDNIVNNTNLFIPIDFITEKNEYKMPKDINKTDKIYDIGEKSLKIAENLINNAKTILWNGPFGLYEKGYVESTNNLIDFLKKLDLHDKFVIVGGGDTLAVISKIPDFKCSYISLSGGAMLDYLADGHLPGVDAVTQ